MRVVGVYNFSFSLHSIGVPQRQWWCLRTVDHQIARRRLLFGYHRVLEVCEAHEYQMEVNVRCVPAHARLSTHEGATVNVRIGMLGTGARIRTRREDS